jgi:hypothetical protein
MPNVVIGTIHLPMLTNWTVAILATRLCVMQIREATA